MSDIISRQGALAKIRTRLQDWAAYGNEEYRRGLYACEDMIISLPSAETHDKRTETHGVCSDLISREDAIEAVASVDETDGTVKVFTGRQVNGILSALPSADRPTGEWEDKEVFNETDDDHLVDEWQSARCSVCGKYHTTPFIYYFYNFKFCPNCGAKMYKGGDDE